MLSGRRAETVVTVDRAERVERIEPVGDTALTLGRPADLGVSGNRRFLGSMGVDGAEGVVTGATAFVGEEGAVAGAAAALVGEEGAVTGFGGSCCFGGGGGGAVAAAPFMSLSHFRFVE